MGKIEKGRGETADVQQTPQAGFRAKRRARIVSDLADAPDGDDALTIFCPSAEGLAGYPLDWLCALPIHDANGRLLEALRRPFSMRQSAYAGVFAVDPFRRSTDILAAIRGAGLNRVANFPSVRRFEGALRADFEALGFGFAREVEFIRDAVQRGFSAAGVVASLEEASAMISAGASVLVAMGSPTGLSESAAALAVELVALSPEL